MVYYQIEFLWDKSGGFDYDKAGYVTGITLEKVKPYWALAGGERILSRSEAIERGKKAAYRDEHEEGDNTPWRVVEVTDTERKVIWLDPRIKRGTPY